ncbi:hypothetical protein ACFQ08_19455 [Streptosporangium algeriense]|uniref:Uncharacterized protein n=1 Tax=Streptosporangium algeriense TaxID=1682748 RepID=A0ABW3DSE9_9ACTN
MTTRFRPAALAAAVLGSACLLAAAPAHATTVTEGTAVRVLDGDNVYRDWFVSRPRCETAGQGGLARGHWEHYTCSPGTVWWHLWTNR